MAGNAIQRAQVTPCGNRNLWEAKEDEGEQIFHDVKVYGADVCVYRLFSGSETWEETDAAWDAEVDTKVRLDYTFKINEDETKLWLIEYDHI